MTATWDPWHTVTVTRSVIVELDPEFEDDAELRFAVEHPEPHENGCPENCMTRRAIDEQCDSDLPTEPGVYRIRAWGEYWPATMAGDPSEFNGGIEVEDALRYEPDPQVVRAAAERIIEIEIEEIRNLSGVDIAEMCETELGAVRAAIRPGEDHEEAEDALIEAIRLEIRAATIEPSWLDPFGVGAVSPTDPTKLSAWLRALPEGTILLSRPGRAWELGGSVETSGEGVREFRALLPTLGDDPAEIPEGYLHLDVLAEIAPFMVIALGTTRPEAGA